MEGSPMGECLYHIGDVVFRGCPVLCKHFISIAIIAETRYILRITGGVDFYRVFWYSSVPLELSIL